MTEQKPRPVSVKKEKPANGGVLNFALDAVEVAGKSTLCLAFGAAMLGLLPVALAFGYASSVADVERRKPLEIKNER